MGRAKDIGKRAGALLQDLAWTSLGCIYRGWELEAKLPFTHPPLRSRRRGVGRGAAGDARSWCRAGSRARCCEGMAGRRDLRSKPTWGREKGGERPFLQGLGHKGLPALPWQRADYDPNGNQNKGWGEEKSGVKEEGRKNNFYFQSESGCALEGLP